jgi:hypothetical protein
MYRTVAIAALLFGVVAGAACGGDDDDGGEGRVQRPTTTAPSVEEEVEAAYLAYWDLAQRLAAAPDLADPEIADRATGAVLDQLTESLTALEARGEVVVAGDGYRHDIQSVGVDGDTATIDDCSVDDAARLEADSGDVIEERLVTVSYQATLTLDGRTWRVGDLTQIAIWEGVAGCAA